jgi:hypothetical protein
MLLTCSFLLVNICANAQKLPKIQQTSFRAPLNIRIDGKLNEWDNQFKAYNTATEVFYTLSNDDKYLYLALQANDPLVIRKIINAGITFTINTSGNKKDHNIAFTYPIFDKQNFPVLNLRQKPIVTKDSTIGSKQIDSFVNEANSQLSSKAKEIKIKGIPGFTDSLISVYNKYEIKAASLFNHKIAYNYELAIPIKYLGLTINDPVKFIYNIQLNGSFLVEGVIFTPPDANGNTSMTITVKNPPRGIELQYMKYPNDFWGEYNLAVK